IGVAAPVRRPYTAPERVAGRMWNRSADVYSLAALVHELLWGRRVSSAEALEPLPGADQGILTEAFARALADDPAARFETALAFVEALREAFSDEALLVSTVDPTDSDLRLRVPGRSEQ